MRDIFQRETVVMLLGLVLLVGIFIFGIHRPGERTSLALKREIGIAQRSIAEVPARVAEFEVLHHQIDLRRRFLRQTVSMIPRSTDLYRVVDDVSRRAQEAGLNVTRLEPLPVRTLATYEVHPFQIGISGTFEDVAAFLHSLEQCERVFMFEELVLAGRERSTDGVVSAEATFSAYVLRADDADSDENDTSLTRRSVDMRR